MKTTLTRIKTVIQSNQDQGDTLQYVKYVEITPEDVNQLLISRSILPSVFIFPIRTSETYEASQKKSATHIVGAHLMMEYNQRELAIIGDSSRASTFGKGILDFVEDFETILRGHRLATDGTPYLDKPIEFPDIRYLRSDLSENTYLMIATVTMECKRVFLQTSLPGNINS